MTRAYNPLYLEDVMNNLGTMFDCAVHVMKGLSLNNSKTPF